jgi:pilus assembly protein TadC
MKRSKIIDEVGTSLGEYVLEYIIYLDSGYDSYRSLKLLSMKEDSRVITRELKEAVNRIQNGVSFSKALSGISDRIYEANLDTFLRIISRGYIRGESGMQADLRILIERILYEEITAKKVKAEKASTKLSLPITIIFIAIVLISVYPALAQFRL